MKKSLNHLKKCLKHMKKCLKHMKKCLEHMKKCLKHMKKCLKHMKKRLEHMKKCLKHMKKCLKHPKKCLHFDRSDVASQGFQQILCFRAWVKKYTLASASRGSSRPFAFTETFLRQLYHKKIACSYHSENAGKTGLALRFLLIRAVARLTKSWFPRPTVTFCQSGRIENTHG